MSTACRFCGLDPDRLHACPQAPKVSAGVGPRLAQLEWALAEVDRLREVSAALKSYIAILEAATAPSQSVSAEPAPEQKPEQKP